MYLFLKQASSEDEHCKGHHYCLGDTPWGKTPVTSQPGPLMCTIQGWLLCRPG